jgi:hypothetical protein
MRRFMMTFGGTVLVLGGSLIATAQEGAPGQPPDKQAPLQAPMQAPKQAPMQAPMQAPNKQAPLQAPMQAPKQAPMQAPTPVQKHVQAPIQKHAMAQVQSPVQKGGGQMAPPMKAAYSRGGLFAGRFR